MKQSVELASRAVSQKLREEGSLGVKERKIVMEGHELGRGFGYDGREKTWHWSMQSRETQEKNIPESFILYACVFLIDGIA